MNRGKSKPNDSQPRVGRLLDSFAAADICPLCETERRAVLQHIEAILGEHVNDGLTRAVFRRAGGYCTRHTRILLSLHQGLGTAILHHDLLESILARGLRPQPRWLQNPHAARKRECPLCDFQYDARRRQIATLHEALALPRTWEILEQSHPLCLPHLRLLLAVVREPQQRRKLLEMQQQRYRTLLHELSEYIRKYDYRRQEQGFGPEADSWVRAARICAGHEDVF